MATPQGYFVKTTLFDFLGLLLTNKNPCPETLSTLLGNLFGLKSYKNKAGRYT